MTPQNKMFDSGMHAEAAIGSFFGSEETVIRLALFTENDAVQHTSFVSLQRYLGGVSNPAGWGSGANGLGVDAYLISLIGFAGGVFFGTGAFEFAPPRAEKNLSPISTVRFEQLETFASLEAFVAECLTRYLEEEFLASAAAIAITMSVEGEAKLLVDLEIKNGQVCCTATSLNPSITREWIDNFLDHVAYYNDQLFFNRDRAPRSVDLVSSAQWAKLHDINSTYAPYPRDSNLVSQLMEILRSERADQVAIISQSHTLTYRDVLSEASRIAAWLDKNFDVNGRAVAVIGDRSERVYSCYLAIVMAGGYYVPVSAADPKSRIEEILFDADICTAMLMEPVEGLVGDYVLLDDLQFPDGNFVPKKRSPTSVSYAMYTSGSTGKPKGVLVTDRNILRLAYGFHHVTWKADDRIGGVSSHSFDAATFEIWAGLLNAVPIVHIPKAMVLDLPVLARYLRDFKVTAMVITSSLLTHIATRDPNILSTLRYLLYGGEVTSVETIKRIRQICPTQRLVHGYGPTENTTISTHFDVTSEASTSRLPIGRPVANSTAWVVDRHFRPLPMGVRGMLVVSGDGVAAGYLNQPALTARHFIRMPDALALFEGDIGYLTGDFGRWDHDFNLEFLGRADDQIKIRGHRIEIDEVRDRLSAIHGVEQAEVLPVADNSGGFTALEAYVVLKKGVSIEGVRRSLSEYIPSYMMPRSIHMLKSFPLKTSGKVDKAALAHFVPEQVAEGAGAATGSRNDRDAALLEIWRTLLGVTEISIDDSYAALGGHSMMLLDMAEKIYDELGVDFSLTEMVNFVTVRDFSDAIAERSASDIAASAP